MFVLYIISFYAFIVFTRSDTVISTHASAREATPNGTFPIATSKFQSTLPRGKRLRWQSKISGSSIFQSTLPRGKRRCFVWCKGFLSNISIHASAREATHSLAFLLADSPFQSTLPRGKRLFGKGSKERRVYLFQSTLPRGKRRKCRVKGRIYYNFNPRFREGSDGQTLLVVRQYTNFNPRFREGSDFTVKIELLHIMISIHASAREATESEIGKAIDSIISIHASAREATLLRTCPHLANVISIHASAREATISAFQQAGIPLFQSTLPRGKRLCW